jgi:hypothetical protein
MSDLFSVSFLAFLGILVLAIALLVVYFESKSREQNHKIASMFSVVSTLAEDLNNVKMGINQLAFNGMNGAGPSLAENMHPFNMNQEHNHLIEVSDDEDDENEVSDEDETENEDSDDEDDSDDDNLEEFEDDDSDFDSEPINVKVLKIEDPLLDPLLEKVEQKFDNLEDLEENLEVDEDYDQETFEEEPLQLVENDFIPEETTKNEKSIKIDLGEAIDYKKLTLQKLKSIVTEKGLATDTSKLKKPDLLKLLGIE